jgi:hypothetical protein
VRLSRRLRRAGQADEKDVLAGHQAGEQQLALLGPVHQGLGGLGDGDAELGLERLGGREGGGLGLAVLDGGRGRGHGFDPFVSLVFAFFITILHHLR